MRSRGGVRGVGVLARVILLASLALWSAVPLLGQGNGYNSAQLVIFTTPTSGSAVTQRSLMLYHQIKWTPVAASACAVQVDSSPDGISWTSGGIITTQTCTSVGNSAVVAAQANFLRITVTSFTGTTVSVQYEGWAYNPSGGGSGVASITAGTGLTGGTIGSGGSGTFALAPALPNGETATTQAAGDTSTQVATDNFFFVNDCAMLGCIDGAFGYISGDPCATIATNLTAAVATNPQSIDLQFGRFAKIFTNGLIPCQSNPFENQVFSGHVFLGPTQIIKSVPWITPGNNQRVGIYGDGTSDPGIAIASTASTLTDCDVDAPGWNGTACVVNGITVPAFPSTGHCITFTYPHGSFGAATYCPSLWLGGMGAAGVNFGGSFGSVIQDFTIQPGKGGGNFGVYSSGIQEQSYCLNVVVRDSNNSGFFFDKVQGNGSGPGHFKMTSCTARAGLDVTQAAAQGYPNVANQIGMGYGIWFEGNGIQVYFTGGTCTTYPQGYPTTIAGGAVTAIKMTYAGSCSNVTGLTCHIGSQHGGTGETCAATTSVNTVTGITAGGVGTGYSLGDTQTGGAFEIEDATINGKNTQNMQEAIVMEGVFSPTVRSIHTGFDAGWGVHVGYGGGTVVGGVFENLDLENTSNGVLRFGVGIDNNQIVLGTGRGGSVASIQDDNNNFTSGTNVPCSLYEPGTLSTCTAGGVTIVSNTDTAHVPLTVNAIVSQAADLQDWGVNNSVLAFLNNAGNATLPTTLNFSGASGNITTSTTNASLNLTPNGTGQVNGPAGTTTVPGYGFTGNLTTGISACAANILCLLANGTEIVHVTGGEEITSNGSYKFSQTAAANGTVGASIGITGTGGTEAPTISGNSTGLFLFPSACKRTTTAAMTVSGTPVTFCSFTLPNTAQTWAWQCSGTYTTTTATDTLSLGYTVAQTPVGVTGNAIIYSTLTGTSTAGSVTSTTSTANQVMLTGASVSNVTNEPFTSSGVLQAGATSGTFVLTGALTGTSPSGTINPGTTCWLY